jgi:drug/metabolite transporter (DMT)-like permease
MTAALGGLGAALVWSLGNMFAARAAHALGPLVTLAWVMLVGLVVLGVTLAVGGSAPALAGGTVAWLALAGAGNAAGLLLLYRALRIGQMGVVMPLVSTEGGLTALIAVIAGQSIGAVAALAMVGIVAGVAMTSPRRSPGQGVNDRRAAAITAVAAVAMSLSMYATGRAGSLVPVAWAILPPRLLGVLVVTVPLALTGRLRRPPRAGQRVGWWLGIAGVCEVAGFLLYALGARHSIPVAAVLSSLTGAMGVAWGRLVFAERLRPVQLAGVAVIFAGVAVVSVTTV